MKKSRVRIKIVGESPVHQQILHIVLILRRFVKFIYYKNQTLGQGGPPLVRLGKKKVIDHRGRYTGAPPLNMKMLLSSTQECPHVVSSMLLCN